MSKAEVYEHVLKPMQAAFSMPPQVNEGNNWAALEEYAAALTGFTSSELKTGWAEVRNSNAKAWWPPIGALVKACAAARTDRIRATPREKTLNGRMVDGEFQPWSGCRCDQCVTRRRRDGYYRAPAAAHEVDAQIWQRFSDAAAYHAECAPRVQRGEPVGDYVRRYRAWRDERGGYAAPHSPQDATPAAPEAF